MAALCACLAVWSAVRAFYGQPVLGAIAALFWLQLTVASLRGSTLPGGKDPDGAAEGRVWAPLAELCARVGCPVPRITITRGGTRPLGVRSGTRKLGRLLVISRFQLDRLDDPELRAVLAHEVIHLVHDDMAASRRRALGAQAAAIAVCIAAILVAPNLAAYPIWMAACLAGAAGGMALLSLTNRWRETRADAEGALLAGDPAALARALTTLEQLGDEMRQRLYRPPILRWLLWPWSNRLPSHPPLAARIAHLQEVAAAQRREGFVGTP
jgi:heat shock protein HtpX